METLATYQKLQKPNWAPPASVFGPVWTLLYLIIAISFGTVLYEAMSGRFSLWILLPFALNLVFNFIFTPLQFLLKNNFLAALDILLVLITLLWALISIYPLIPWVAYCNLPYLAWVSFATVLQLTITYLNR